MPIWPLKANDPFQFIKKRFNIRARISWKKKPFVYTANLLAFQPLRGDHQMVAQAKDSLNISGHSTKACIILKGTYCPFAKELSGHRL
jgi:hypothetical protein